MTLLVTGVAGFIGFHVADALLARGERVIGVDNLNDYYDPGLKQARLARLEGQPGFGFRRLDIAEDGALAALAGAQPEIAGVVHLAAQAGVRYSLENPQAYLHSNVTGQLQVLEACRRLPRLAQLVYASSSSVYGANEKLPFSEDDPVDRPTSIYAATKRAGELLAATYARLYGLPATGLRFFTVYGPWGRPDMAYWRFAEAILDGRPITLFNEGRMKRDFTYIDEVVAGVLAALDRPLAAGESPPHRLYNLGNNRPVALGRFVEALELACGRKAERRLAPMQPGEVEATYADIGRARRDLGFEPKTGIEEGLKRFVGWFREWNGRKA
ncbi:MAG: NAD-dependent epimerase/dehydratase family protein [Kiloniellales bacterium]